MRISSLELILDDSDTAEIKSYEHTKVVYIAFKDKYGSAVGEIGFPDKDTAKVVLGKLYAQVEAL